VTLPRAVAEDRASTTWEWRRCKMQAPPGKGTTQSPKAASLPRRGPRRKPSQTWTIVYRGGPECFYLVVCGERTRRLPGWLCLSDVAGRMGLMA
jgi:hypothetical protein